MDINYYLQREQIERVRADRAASPDARDAHERMAESYREQVEGYRRGLLQATGAQPDPRPPAL